jgi:hypothetical protein
MNYEATANDGEHVGDHRREKKMRTVSEERYQENLRRQAEDIFRSWGCVKGPDGAWRKPISADAVIKRINRILEQQNPGEFLRIKKTRGSRAQQDLGDFYLLNGKRNFIVDHHLDLDELAKQHKVLSSTEQMEKAT